MTAEAAGAAGTDEFEIIARCFAPLAAGAAEARGLKDDAAVARLAGDTVLTADAIVEGVHFLPTDPLADVARKALRVNLSDLAAKGARPLGYLLTLMWPQGRDAGGISALAEGLAADQARFGVALWGGDTVTTPGPLTLAITFFGQADPAGAPSRAGAKPGDEAWLFGTIGDGFLGLAAAREEPLGLAPGEFDALRAHYRAPEPQLAAARLIAAFATAAMDVSDGLLDDAAKLAAASGVALDLDAEAIPLSAAAARWRAAAPDPADALRQLATGGDDYSLLFTAASGRGAALRAAGEAAGLRLTRIGAASSGTGVTIRDGAGAPLGWGGGYRHRLGQ